MKNIWLFLLICLTFVQSTWAKTYTFDFSTKIPNGWTSSVNPNSFETNNPARGAQFTTNAVLTLKDVTNATKVILTCSANTDKNSVAVAVNSKSLGKSITLAKESNAVKTFEGSALSGDLTLTLTRSEKSMYIKKVEVVCDTVYVQEEEGEKEDPLKLDPDHVYSEPTTIVATGENKSNAAFKFKQNNILVDCSTGGQTADYFGCNAGQRITFTASKPIVAMAINGYVKANFNAEASSGDLYFTYDEEEAIEQNPVLYVEDINATSITLSCEKQLRCYDVKFYFEEAPELNLDSLFGGTGFGDDFTFEYEPAKQEDLHLEFEEAYLEMYSEPGDEIPMTDLYFANEDYEMELLAYTDLKALQIGDSILCPIDTLYAKNHVSASIGYSDDLGAMPSYIITDFIQYDGDWYWESIFHLMSGKVMVKRLSGSYQVNVEAKSYNGTLVYTTFTGTFIEEEDAISNLNADKAGKNGKFVKNGNFFIEKDGHQFNALGQETRTK